METDNTTGTESDTSEWDLANAALTSENSEDSDEYGIYYGEEHIFESVIGDGNQRSYRNVMTDQQANLQMRKILNQMNTSVGDGRYGVVGSLYPIHETVYTGTDSADSYEENSDAIVSDQGSPVHNNKPVYGRYQKLQNLIEDLDSEHSFEDLMLHRLPGENLGMILGIEGGKDGSGNVTSVTVKSVTLGGAAYRATGGKKGICVGDEIVTVNGLDLCTLSHDECIQVFKDMPLRAFLGIKRGQKDIPAYSVSPLPFQEMDTSEKTDRSNKPAKSKPKGPVEITRRREASDSEDDGFAGFAVYKILVEKEPNENLGISIVPSYGSTREYYQIKRILPSGAAAHSGNLQVGDRLITCNGASLRGLTQTHCLNIIKAASSCGNINFEVIRPVYTGSSMEISVTVNNSTHANSRHIGYDPSQYSLKSQSYDRNVDVVVTSESEDYLTVSEDEFSKTGRLANISESEAHQVFVSNSVRLAYQTPINTIEEESTETETENIPDSDVLHETESIEIVDLNKIDTSPYHIPHPRKNSNKEQSELDLKLDLSQFKIEPKNVLETSTLPKLPLIHKIPQSELDKISISSQSPRSPRSDSDILSPRSPLPKSDLDQIIPRSPVPRSDLNCISPRSPVSGSDLDWISSRSPALKASVSLVNQKSPASKTGHTEASLTSSHPERDWESSRSPVPSSDLDNIVLRSPVPYTRRQQVPSDSETLDLDLPYNYPPESIADDILVSDSERTRYNPLYEDSNLSEFTDSENQDIFLTSSRNKNYIPSSDLDKFSFGSNRIPGTFDVENDSVGSNEESLAVPPPVEFSDNKTNFNYIENQKNKHTERNFDEDANLAFNSELTAPFDIVLQEQGIDTRASLEIDTVDDDQILEVLTSDDSGTILISQFEQPKSYIHSKVGHFNQGVDNNSVKMDDNSEAMLKDALDMEYETLSDTAKYENRLNLGDKMENNEDDSEEICEFGHNFVAENIAQDIIQKEQGSYGVYVESDDEPDQFPDEDAPEDLPDLPDLPPPVLSHFSPESDVNITIKMNGVEVDNYGIVASENETLDIRERPVEECTKKTFNVKIGNENINEHAEHKSEATQKVEILECIEKNSLKNRAEPDIIVPVKVERKVDIPVEFKSEEVEDEIIVPFSANREFQLPSTFVDVKMASPRSEKQDIDSLDTDIPKKKPPAVSPKPRKSKVVDQSSTNEPESKHEEVAEEEIVPIEVKKDNTKHLVNVISVVNTLKAGAKDRDPDHVDKIEKEHIKDKAKNAFSSIIQLGEENGGVVDMSPPTAEQVNANREQITVKRQVNVEASPPKADTIEESKQVITRKSIKKDVEVEKQPPKDDTRAMKTVISVEKSKVDHDTKPDVSKDHKDESKIVPLLDLSSVSTGDTDSLSPEINQSCENKAEQAIYKTTIGVQKTEPSKADQEPDNAYKHKTSTPVAKQQEQPESNARQQQTSGTVPRQIDQQESVARHPVQPVPVTEQPTISLEMENSPENEIAEKERASLKKVSAPEFKTLSHIRPLSFNPKSLSQSGSRPAEFKTTISTLGIKPGLSSLSKPLTQKEVEHPIKRMETMPFEVSILKGILGIGIKTAMTPEGFVKVTEILPNGPVGREGNIKVGDYILSINNTQLTGLTDAKVQQVLRLLPRGLSKIVASAVPPDQCEENVQATVEKPQLASHQQLEKPKSAPKQPSPLTSLRDTPLTSLRDTGLRSSQVSVQQVEKAQSSDKTSPRQLSITTNPNASVSVHHQPVPAPRSPSSVKVATVSKQPPVAPKPAKRPTAVQQVPVPSPRSDQGESQGQVNGIHPQQQQQLYTSSSPNVSPVSSPRTPPPVAPKPKKTPSKKPEPVEDPNAPIEVEVFVSINANTESSPNQKSKNILPGSVNYDIVEKDVSKTKWTAGVVSSTDIGNQRNSGGDKGTVDVVKDTDFLHDKELVDVVEDTHVSPDAAHNTDTQITDITTLNSNVAEQSGKSHISDNNLQESITNQFKDIEKDLENSQTDILLSGRSRSFSASSNSSSHEDFNECDVVEENIPEEIAEEEDNCIHVSKDEDYVSDFEEEALHDPLEDLSQTRDTNSEVDMDKLKIIAETIVSDVISSVKTSDLVAKDVKMDESDTKDEASVVPSVAPPLPSSVPPSRDIVPPVEKKCSPPMSQRPIPTSVACSSNAVVPPTMAEAPPPLPQSPPPIPESEPPNKDNNHSTVVDLTLYPDFDQGSEETLDHKTEQTENNPLEVIDVVDMYVTSELHAAAPTVSEKPGTENISIIDIHSDISKNIDDYLPSQVTEELKDQEDHSDELVNNSVDKNDNISKNYVPDVSNDTNANKEVVINDVKLSNYLTDNVIKNETELSEAEIQVYDTTDGAEEKLMHVEGNVNGYGEHMDKTSPRADHEEDKPVELKSPKEGTKYSSRVDEILSHTENLERGKCNPDTDRMIRMFSTSDEPVNEGDGEIIEVRMNKGVTGLGFIIQGGKFSPKGDLPLSIKRIFKGGPADGILQERDEILLVNGEDLSNMRHSEAWTHLKFLPSGEVVLKLRRYPLKNDTLDED